MELTQFTEENYMQYADVEEIGTNVALITKTVLVGNEEREIIVDCAGFYIFGLNIDTMKQTYLAVECSFVCAGLMVLAMPENELFTFKLEEI